MKWWSVNYKTLDETHEIKECILRNDNPPFLWIVSEYLTLKKQTDEMVQILSYNPHQLIPNIPPSLLIPIEDAFPELISPLIQVSSSSLFVCFEIRLECGRMPLIGRSFANFLVRRG